MDLGLLTEIELREEDGASTEAQWDFRRNHRLQHQSLQSRKLREHCDGEREERSKRLREKKEREVTVRFQVGG